MTLELSRCRPWAVVLATLCLACCAWARQDDPGTEVSVSKAITSFGQTPGDPDLAASPTHVVTVSNEEIAVYAKSSFAQWVPATVKWRLYTDPDPPFAPGLWADAVQPFDPEVVYDPFHDRFWIMAIESITSTSPMQIWFDIAVSKGPDPTQGWHTYRLDAKAWAAEGFFHPDTFRFDSPNMAVDSEWLYLNAWCHVGRDTTVVKTPIWILGKAEAMTSALPLVQKFTAMPDSSVTPRKYNRKAVPALVQKQDPSDHAPQLLLGVDPDQSTYEDEQAAPFLGREYDEVTLHAVVFNNELVPSVVSFEPAAHLLTAFPYFSPQDHAPQPPTPTHLRQLRLTSSRFWGTPVQRGDDVWAVHQVRESAATCDRTVAHWYKFAMNGWPNTGTPQLAESGAIRPAGPGTEDDHSFYPSIAVNAIGQALVSYNQSGIDPGDFVSIRRTVVSPALGAGQIKTAALGPFQPTYIRPTTDCSGGDPGPFRWGDYSGSDWDPVDLCTVWTHHSFASDADALPNRWHTWLARTTVLELCVTDYYGPDYYPDRTLDSLDLLAFEDLFLQQSPRADFNRDGRLDVEDHASLVRRLSR